MQKHLGFRKGVVYSRSRTQCESFAAELESAHYHAGAVDKVARGERQMTLIHEYSPQYAFLLQQPRIAQKPRERHEIGTNVHQRCRVDFPGPPLDAIDA